MTYLEACRELRRSGALYEVGRITGDQWVASVRRILAALERGRSG